MKLVVHETRSQELSFAVAAVVFQAHHSNAECVHRHAQQAQLLRPPLARSARRATGVDEPWPGGVLRSHDRTPDLGPNCPRSSHHAAHSTQDSCALSWNKM